jgi:hypothetical protein
LLNLIKVLGRYKVSGVREVQCSMMGELKQIHNFRGQWETPGLATFYGTTAAPLPYSTTGGTHSGGLEMLRRSVTRLQVKSVQIPKLKKKFPKTPKIGRPSCSIAIIAQFSSIPTSIVRFRHPNLRPEANYKNKNGWVIW